MANWVAGVELRRFEVRVWVKVRGATPAARFRGGTMGLGWDVAVQA